MQPNETSLQTGRLAEQILSDRFGTRVYLGEGRDLGGSARSQVLRFPVLAGPAIAPASVIVKQTNQAKFDSETANDAAWMLFNDWASLQFLSTLQPSVPFAPTFYGGERGAGLFVMEDLGEWTRLDHLLLGDDPGAAEAGLLAYTRSHGRLHVLTLGRETDYLSLRESFGPPTPPSSSTE